MSRKNLNVQLLIVDPNIDFMGNDDGSPYSETLVSGVVRTASLPVKGAVSDAKRAAALIDRIGHKLDDIHVTLDSHHTMHIAHPDMWLDGNGRQPAPYTLIKASDMKSGMWRARNPGHQKRLYDYLVALEATGRLHCIWPPHCRIGTWGHNVEPTLEAALTSWERTEIAVVDYVTKGSSVLVRNTSAASWRKYPIPTIPRHSSTPGSSRPCRTPISSESSAGLRAIA